MKILMYLLISVGVWLLGSCASPDCDQAIAPIFAEYGWESQLFVYENGSVTLAPEVGHGAEAIRWELPSGRSISDSVLTIGPMQPEMAGSYTMSALEDGCWASRSIILNYQSLKPDCTVEEDLITFVLANDSSAHAVEVMSVNEDYRGFTAFSISLLEGYREIDFAFREMPEPGAYEVWNHLPNSGYKYAMSMSMKRAFIGDYYPDTSGTGTVLVRLKNGKRVMSFCNLHLKSRQWEHKFHLYGEVVLEE